MTVKSRDKGIEALYQQFYECVEFYRNIFSFEEGRFNLTDVDNIIQSIPLKGPLIEIKPKVHIKTNNVVAVNSKNTNQERMVPKVEYLTETVTTGVNSKKKKPKTKSTNAEEVKTFEEEKVEEEKVINKNEEEDAKLKKELSEDGFHLVEKKVFPI